MAIRTLGNRGGAPAPQQQAQQPAPARQAPQAQAPRGGGLPPPPAGWTPPAPGSGGGFQKKTDKEWDAEPLRDGEHTFDMYVAKIVAWNSGGTTLTWRVNQWDRAANRSGAQHGRPVRWDQQPRKKVLEEYLANPHDEKAAKRYGNWRHDIVSAYRDAGHPEESWPKDQAGNPVPPWDRFFAVNVGGVFVPVMFTVRMRAWSMSSDGREPFRAVDVQSVTMIKTDDGRPFQAPLPYEVPEPVARAMRWIVAETRDLPNNLATVAVIDRNSVGFPHNNMPTYKDL